MQRALQLAYLIQDLLRFMMDIVVDDGANNHDLCPWRGQEPCDQGFQVWNR